MIKETKHEPLIQGTSKNPFCGPTALALLLNWPLDKVDSLLKELYGTSIQRGLFYPEVLQVLEEQGCKVKIRSKATFLNDKNGLYLICYKRHFGTVKNGLYYDNSFPLGTTEYPRLWIEKVFEVTRP